ncbi:peptide chain release factor N(5)-glutamine methyltransferase [Wenzhouxiangella sp. EGI_FJ10305]|uniref:peptide chain release factor N(5)-glutamine methyltransferase n=1 Tax=Wenzhouxiangella sp. EGI_FJ10305 TaxID=3243768 RepID=UPI0035E13B7B
MQSTTSTEAGVPTTVGAALGTAATLLGQRLEAELLLAHAVGRERAWLYAHADEPIAADQWRICRDLFRQRLEGWPVAYLLERREFYGRPFQIGEGVLIPRPETELLIDIALNLPLPESARAVDVGTGSGCVALTLAAERPDWQITATDISAEALAIAARNRDQLGLDPVELICGDLFEPVEERLFELIVSNPPYVAEEDPHLELGDVRFEPRRALAAGPDGLYIIRRLVPESWGRLQGGGWLLIEHGYDQAEAVRLLLERTGFAAVQSHRDLAGIERATAGMKPG